MTTAFHSNAGGPRGPWPPPPGPIKLVIKKMAAKGGRIDFMFLGPPYPAAGCATVSLCILESNDVSWKKHSVPSHN